MRRAPTKSRKTPPRGVQRMRGGSRGVQRMRGDSICVACFYESELAAAHHCLDCDGEVCGFCVVMLRETGEFLCPECAEERKAEAQ